MCAHKRPNGTAINRVLGALSFVAAPRAVWALMRDPSNADRRLMLSLKSNVSDDNQGLRFCLRKPEGMLVPRVEWGAQPVAMSFQSASAAAPRFNLAEQQYRGSQNHVIRRLQEELSDGPISRIGLDTRGLGTEEQLYNAAEALGVIKVKDGYDIGWTWMLPEHFPKWQQEKEQQQRQQERERRRRKREKARKAREAKRQAMQQDQKPVQAVQEASGSAQTRAGESGA